MGIIGSIVTVNPIPFLIGLLCLLFVSKSKNVVTTTQKGMRDSRTPVGVLLYGCGGATIVLLLGVLMLLGALLVVAEGAKRGYM